MLCSHAAHILYAIGALVASASVTCSAETLSPRMNQLKRALVRQQSAAVRQFWAQVSGTGTPLVERIPGDPRHAWLTFLWHAREPVQSVAVVSFYLNGNDLANGQMLQLAETDLWFRTYRVSSMARFTYGLSLNHPMPSLPSPREVDAWIAAAQPDPLNPKPF